MADPTNVAISTYRKLKQAEHKVAVLDNELNTFVVGIPQKRVEEYLTATLEMDEEFAEKTEKALRPKRRGRPRVWEPRKKLALE